MVPRFLRSVGLVGCAVSVVVSCGGARNDAGDRPSVVVTFSPLASVVESIVGDAADVTVLVPNGIDPHEFAPSARDVERLRAADIVVANGLELEEGLVDSLRSVPTLYEVADHVTVRANDPHVWLDPMTIAEAVPSLAAALGDAIDVDLADAATRETNELTSIDTEVREILDGVPSCTLVTGHESLGYFGARYGCDVVGSIVPGLSSTAEATAADLANLRQVIEDRGVSAIFVELGTPSDVADQLSRETGASVVELATHFVPEQGGYRAMMTSMARAIAGALS